MIMNAMTTSRKYTNILLEYAKHGALSWETLARECLQYMSEGDVQDMAHVFINDVASEPEEDDDDAEDICLVAEQERKPSPSTRRI